MKVKSLFAVLAVILLYLPVQIANAWQVTWEIPRNLSEGLYFKKKNYEINYIIKIKKQGVLQLAPGTKLSFGPGGGIVSYGTLKAIGTKTDPIIFTASEENKGWRNITLLGKSSNDSILENCIITHGGGIQDEYLKMKLLKGVYTGYTITTNGGGIYLYESDATITNCKIIGNNCESDGGGLYLYKSNSKLTNLEIKKNHGDIGGGIYMVSSNPTISNSLIEENLAIFRGGGLAIHESKPIISKCTIGNNQEKGVVVDGFEKGL